MNILALSWRGPGHPLGGGAEQVMHEHMKGWISSGHKVTLFTSTFEGARQTETLDGVTIIRSGGQLIGVHLQAFLWYMFGKHEKFDIVIDQFHGIPFFTPLYVRVPILAVIQEVTREVWFAYPLVKPFNWFFGALGYVAEPLVFQLYRLFSIPFMTGSESAKNEVSSMGIRNNNVVIVPHGVLINKPKGHIQKEKISTFVFLGALAKDKGIEDAIKAFAILNKKGKFQFWIIGKASPDYEKFLKTEALKQGLKKNLTFWGFVSPENKFKLLSRAHIMLNPSIREGWGLVNIEANACKTPVVAYRSQGLIDSVKAGKSGIFAKEKTPEALAQSCLSLIKDQKLLNSLQKGAFKWSEQFSWEKSRKKSMDLIEKVANEKNN
jgi:glycosyltransferase involved in cell wall biosynthesis